MQVLEIADGSERFTIKATEEMVASLAFSLDGQAVVSGAGYTDTAIQIWSAHDGTHLGTLEGQRSWIGDLIFTPDGSRLISASADQTIRLWEWPSRKPAGILRGHLDEVDGVEITADGRTLASRCKDGSIYLWDVTKPSGHPGYQTFPKRLDFQTAAFASDSRSVVAADVKGRVAVWDTLTLNETRHLCGESTNRSSISGDASRVVQADADGRLHVWDVRSGLERTNFLVGPELRGEWPTDNGKFIVTYTTNRSATNFSFEIWESDTARRAGLISVQGRRPIGSPAAMSLPNSFVIATPETIQFFDLAKPNQAPTQINIHQSELYGMAGSPDGRLAAAAYGSGFVRLWDLATLQPVDAVKGFLLGAHSVTFSPDGKRFAAGSNGQEAVKLWDTDTRQEVLTLSGEGSEFMFLRFSPDGRLLLGINQGGVAHLWSAPTWDEIAAAGAKEKLGTRRP
jgi:WD40 repeat protein